VPIAGRQPLTAPGAPGRRRRSASRAGGRGRTVGSGGGWGAESSWEVLAREGWVLHGGCDATDANIPDAEDRQLPHVSRRKTRRAG
jgi:hypothetical protein